MKTIGLIGGTSWESTAVYYKLINQEINKRLGGLNSAKIILHSLNMEEFKQLQIEGKMDEACALYCETANKLEVGGADMILICANTPHIFAPEIKKHISIPIVHIARATGQAIKDAGLKTMGLLGTKITMETDFYKKILTEEFGLDVLVPDQKGRDYIDGKIFSELCLGKFTEETRQGYLNIINKLKEQGAQGIILGCTEIPILIKAQHTNVQLFDTTRIHVMDAVRRTIS
ncbi:aspartate/glutamate racemase family protein [bacterium]|nr:aspartate/glutamate racemase family protein [bacterium]MBU1917625.1 aspartate/glutamate racemase family protein [bacterium]